MHIRGSCLELDNATLTVISVHGKEDTELQALRVYICDGPSPPQVSEECTHDNGARDKYRESLTLQQLTDMQ